LTTSSIFDVEEETRRSKRRRKDGKNERIGIDPYA
jgi:hypothetical protein